MKINKILLILSIPFLTIGLFGCDNKNPSAPQGEQGVAGETGPQGDKGLPGNKGETGEAGTPGKDGQDGVVPNIGDNGHWWIGETDTGIDALGPEGSKGEPGVPGTNGQDGTNGTDGKDGQDGDKGPIGDQGLKGPTGEKGETGDKGPLGDQGSKGPTGEKGETGDKGPEGKPGDKGEQGPQGDKGPTGEQGSKGPTGEQGEVGDKGPQGPQGDTGDKGLPGEVGQNTQALYEYFKTNYSYLGSYEEWLVDFERGTLGTKKNYILTYYSGIEVHYQVKKGGNNPVFDYQIVGDGSWSSTVLNGYDVTKMNVEEFVNNEYIDLANPTEQLISNATNPLDNLRGYRDMELISHEPCTGFIGIVPTTTNPTTTTGFRANAYYVDLKTGISTKLDHDDLLEVDFFVIKPQTKPTVEGDELVFTCSEAGAYQVNCYYNPNDFNKKEGMLNSITSFEISEPLVG